MYNFLNGSSTLCNTAVRGASGRPSKLIEHPYCTSDFCLTRLYLCTKCNDNWHTYRKNAEDGKYLILDGEENEEICSVCADYPNDSQLVMCATCPRSYCNTCLNKILRPSDRQVTNLLLWSVTFVCMCFWICNEVNIANLCEQEMDASDDWKCFACFAASYRAEKEKEASTALLPSWVDSYTSKLYR